MSELSNKYVIKDLKILNEAYFTDTNFEKERFLRGLSKLNIFVGENNSGKSRLLRDILKNDIIYVPNYSLDHANEIIRTLKEELTNDIPVQNSQINSDLGKILDQIKEIHEIDKDFALGKNLLALKEFLFGLTKSPLQLMSGQSFSQIGETLISIFKGQYSALWDIYPLILEPPKFKKIFIPPLRGLKPILSVKDYTDLYKDRVIEDYFQKEDGFTIFTGLDIYGLVKSHLLGSLQKRDLIREYERFLSHTFFDDKLVTIIPYENPSRLVIKIGNETEQPIHELGDGIQSLIIITLPLFLNKGEYVLLFIDEPELNMHPGLQRKLIETLLNEKGFEHFQYFITTHSNHLLDIITDYSDVALYSLQKFLLDVETPLQEQTPKFFVEPLSYGDNSILQTLGIRNSSVFLSNCTIWVEGITDRRYFRKYLELYQSLEKFQFKEDLHYSFVEYSGSNITHWSFLDDDPEPVNVDRLCGRLFLIADQPEKNSKKKELRHEKLRERLKECFCELPCKEVENLLSPEVLKKILIEYGEDQTQIPAFKYEDYWDKALGDFLNTIMGEKKKRNYSTGNSISSKVKFCNIAIKNLNEWDDLSDPAKLITRQIVDFIRSNNQSIQEKESVDPSFNRIAN
jgi:predicted ATPase